MLAPGRGAAVAAGILGGGSTATGCGARLVASVLPAFFSLAPAIAAAMPPMGPPPPPGLDPPPPEGVAVAAGERVMYSDAGNYELAPATAGALLSFVTAFFSLVPD